MDEDMPTLLTAREAAARLRLSTTAIYDLVRCGKLPSYRLGGVDRCVLPKRTWNRIWATARRAVWKSTSICPPNRDRAAVALRIWSGTPSAGLGQKRPPANLRLPAARVLPHVYCPRTIAPDLRAAVHSADRCRATNADPRNRANGPCQSWEPFPESASGR
jgi:excisionase family DNA binding protein